MKKEKKRSSIHLYKMSDEVKVALNKKAKGAGVTQWLIAEKILEAALIPGKKVDVKKWLKTL